MQPTSTRTPGIWRPINTWHGTCRTPRGETPVACVIAFDMLRASASAFEELGSPAPGGQENSKPLAVFELLVPTCMLTRSSPFRSTLAKLTLFFVERVSSPARVNEG